VGTVKRVHILGFPADTVTYDKAIDLVAEHIQSREPYWILAVNPEKIIKARSQKDLFDLLSKADLFIPDGVGVLLAGKLKGEMFPQRVTGADLFDRLMIEAAKHSWKVFLLGAAPGVAGVVAEKYRQRFSTLQIVGVHDGYFRAGEEPQVCAAIQTAEPDLVFVAMGSPRQEELIYYRLKKLGIPVCMGVGGSFDVVAGKVNRAPKWMQKVGLEWSYRLLREPRRILRMAALPKFLWQVLRER